MTLDSMAFNIGEGLFSPGQLYVALSRVRNLDNLSLHTQLRQSDVIVSDIVRTYFENFQKKCRTIQLDEDGNQLFPQIRAIGAIRENSAIDK
jgi:hypothetical protein